MKLQKEFQIGPRFWIFRFLIQYFPLNCLLAFWWMSPYLSRISMQKYFRRKWLLLLVGSFFTNVYIRHFYLFIHLSQWKNVFWKKKCRKSKIFILGDVIRKCSKRYFVFIFNHPKLKKFSYLYLKASLNMTRLKVSCGYLLFYL